MAVKPIPDGYNNVNAYLMVDDVEKLLDFLKNAFDAEEFERIATPDGAIMHAEVRIGDSVIMIGPAKDELGATHSMLYVYVEDTNAIYQRALQAGATSIMEPADQFYGDRNAGVKGPCGNLWWIATHIEDVSQDEMMQRMAASTAEKQEN
ncbi:MAG: glyoxalase [Flavobacteriales bacterium]|nr:MAG: glyoxalase [Flavobacteriales bacterium]